MIDDNEIKLGSQNYGVLIDAAEVLEDVEERQQYFQFCFIAVLERTQRK